MDDHDKPVLVPADAREVSGRLCALGIPAKATGKWRVLLQLPEVLPGVRVTLSRVPWTQADPNDSFYGWVMRVRVPRRTRRQMRDSRRHGLWVVWTYFHRAGLISEEPPKDFQEVALLYEETEEDE